MTRYSEVVRALRNQAQSRTDLVSYSFFRNCGKDPSLGVLTPQIRKVARQFHTLPLPDLRKLMRSRFHCERSLGHSILRLRFEKGDPAEQTRIFNFYVRNRDAIRTWDGVDDSAPYIVGRYLLDRDKKLLYRLARSPGLIERRIAIVSTWWFIRSGRYKDTLRLAELLLEDEEELIHRATGWMLREVGKRDLEQLKQFLKAHCRKMPRTMLRYAIEHFPEKERRRYLKAR